MSFKSHMHLALIQARNAGARGEVPIGAVIISPEGRLVASDGNRTRAQSDPTAHAEILAIRAACKAAGSERLAGHALYVTLEPCAMCAAAIAAARISKVYFAAPDPKSGGVLQGAKVFTHTQTHHTPEIYDGICENEAGQLLKDFFAKMRAKPG